MIWHPVDSSNVAEAAHDPEERKLMVRFRSGSTYEYHNVPETILDDLLSASSAGNFVRNELSAYSYSRR